MKLPRLRNRIQGLMIGIAVFAILLGGIPLAVQHLKFQRRVRAIGVELDRPTSLSLESEVPLGEALNLLTNGVSNPALPDGLPIRYDPALTGRLARLLASQVSINTEGVPLSSVLAQILDPVGLTYSSMDGFVFISAKARTTTTDFFLTQAISFPPPKNVRSMLGLAEVDRPSIPFPETKTIVFPPKSNWGTNQEKRINRGSKPVAQPKSP